jgi:hypothetical protein
MFIPSLPTYSSGSTTGPDINVDGMDAYSGFTRLDLFLPPTLFLSFYIIYTVISPRFHTEKQRAYILSVISSGTMTVISLPYVGQYLSQGLERCYEDAQHGWRKDLGSLGVLFFGTYLLGRSASSRCG